jgi:hypothetical protein
MGGAGLLGWGACDPAASLQALVSTARQLLQPGFDEGCGALAGDLVFEMLTAFPQALMAPYMAEVRFCVVLWVRVCKYVCMHFCVALWARVAIVCKCVCVCVFVWRCGCLHAIICVCAYLCGVVGVCSHSTAHTQLRATLNCVLTHVRAHTQQHTLNSTYSTACSLTVAQLRAGAAGHCKHVAPCVRPPARARTADTLGP